ncbi:MAG: hypothetical protein ACOXZ6_12755 [Syntrophomonadaceae bacterium]
MVKQLGLSDKELIIFSIIWGTSQDGMSAYNGGLSYLADWIGKDGKPASKNTILGVMKRLMDKGLVEKHNTNINGVMFSEYSVSPKIKVMASFGNRDGSSKTEPPVQNLNLVVSKTEPVVQNLNLAPNAQTDKAENGNADRQDATKCGRGMPQSVAGVPQNAVEIHEEQKQEKKQEKEYPYNPKNKEEKKEEKKEDSRYKIVSSKDRGIVRGEGSENEETLSLFPDPEKEKVAPKEKAPRRFVKPTVDEIRDYCEKRQNGIDAQYFYDYYEARGWKYGNTHIVDWKACVRTWERNGNRYDRRPASQPAARGQRTQRTGMADFKNVNAEYEGMRPLLESDFDEETLKELNKGIS